MNVILFNNENYIEAKKKIKKVENLFDDDREKYSISFDENLPNIIISKFKWRELPKKIGHGVKIMTIKFNNKVNVLLTKYSSNSYFAPHEHLDKYEIGIIIEGSLKNKFTGIEYFKGDKYKFSPKEFNFLTSKYGCLTHSVLTNESDYILKPISKKISKFI